jgi:glycosyltransferase involved in cell wall biosynthesis
MMTNIAFYFPNKSSHEVDCSDILSGNPGIGGTGYAMLLLAYSLALNDKDLHLTLYVDEEGLFSPNLKVKPIKIWSDLAQKTTEDNIQILVLIHQPACKRNDTLGNFAGDLKIIIWAHNFMSAGELSYYAHKKSVSRIVNAGYEQLDLYRDHAAFKKSTAIHNGINVEDIARQANAVAAYSLRPLNVTYAGNLIPVKGFHVLAKAWRQILKACPDAVLNVIGSGQLYDRNVPLGKYSIADAEYEKDFMPYLTDTNGKILPSVKFWGLLGDEKKKIMQQTRVGVPNPTGRSETFGYTAIELQAYGALVTTIKCPGYLETVCRASGILYDNEKQLASSVIALLGKDENHYQTTIGFIASNFSIDKIDKQWRQLFGEVITNKANSILPIRANTHYGLKRWKEINRKIKNILPLGYQILPSIWFFEEFFQNLAGLLKRKQIIKHILRKYVLKS